MKTPTMTNKKLKLLTLSLILTLTSCKSFTSSGNKTSSENDPSKVIISNYNGGKVTLKEAQTELNKLIAKNEKLKGLTFNNLTSDQKEAIIKEVVINEVAYKEAKKRNLYKDEDYKEALKIFETELLKQKLYMQIAKEASSEENLKKNYDELAKKLEGKKEIRIRYISLITQTEASGLYNILSKSPESFASQAKKKSLDKETAKKGGDLGFVLEDQLPAQIIKEAILLNKGQISKPIALADKWVLIKLEDKRDAKIAKFEDAKAALAQSLSTKALQDFVSNNLKEAKINIVVK